MATSWLLSLLAQMKERVSGEADESGEPCIWSMVAEWPEGHVYDTEAGIIEVTLDADASEFPGSPGQVLVDISRGASPLDFRIPLVSDGAFGATPPKRRRLGRAAPSPNRRLWLRAPGRRQADRLSLQAHHAR